MMSTTARNSNMNVGHFTLNVASGGETFETKVKRYRPCCGSIERYPQDPGYIVLLAHGIGFHKEAWEPTIERLFESDKGNMGPNRILELWAIDAQNHGETAPLNDEVLSRKPDMLTIHHYVDAFVELYWSGLLGKLANGYQKVVLVGHSAGSVGVIYVATRFRPQVPFNMAILVDPPLYTLATADRMTETYRTVEKSTPIRRSIWSSKEAAHDWLKTRAPWKFWHPRILDLYCEYGLRPLPLPFHPNEKGVVLSCSPAQEAAAFTRPAHTLQAVEHLNELCNIIPIHLVFGAKNDMFSREVQDSIHDPSAGRIIASITRIKGAGHLIPQERPEALADALYVILKKNHTHQSSQTPKL